MLAVFLDTRSPSKHRFAGDFSWMPQTPDGFFGCNALRAKLGLRKGGPVWSCWFYRPQPSDTGTTTRPPRPNLRRSRRWHHWCRPPNHQLQKERPLCKRQSQFTPHFPSSRYLFSHLCIHLFGRLCFDNLILYNLHLSFPSIMVLDESFISTPHLSSQSWGAATCGAHGVKPRAPAVWGFPKLQEEISHLLKSWPDGAPDRLLRTQLKRVWSQPVNLTIQTCQPELDCQV